MAETIPSALWHACARKDIAGVILCIASGDFDIDEVGTDGLTPLMCALPNIGIMTALIVSGADIGAKNKGNTAGDIARNMSWDDARALLRDPRIVASSAEIRQRKTDAAAVTKPLVSTPSERLMKACHTKDAAAAREAIHDGAPVEGSDDDSTPPLHKAVEYGAVSVIRILLEAGANPRQHDRHGMVPLHCAFFPLVEIKSAHALIDAGVDVNDAGSEKWYPLHYAVVDDSIDGVQLLVSHGADPFAVPPFGTESAYDVAVRGNHAVIVKMFEAMKPPK